MRIWDLSPRNLCRKHLLGEHAELHAIWKIISEGKKGYSHHPEVIRWKGKLKALFLRHQSLVEEMEKRGYKHLSPLEEKKAKGKDKQEVLINSLEEQKIILLNKNCPCFNEKSI